LLEHWLSKYAPRTAVQQKKEDVDTHLKDGQVAGKIQNAVQIVDEGRL
jgi:hypothetical protein